MKNKFKLKKNYISWLALVLALFAWGFVGFLAWSISDARSVHLMQESTLEEGADELDEILRLHTLTRDTKDIRAELESLVHRDAMSIVEAIEQVGDDARVDIEIGQVLAGSPEPDVSSATPSIHTVGVAVEVLGSFSGVLHAAALLYSLPVPSTIDQMQFERLPAGESSRNKEWRLVVRIQVLTTADISS